MRILICRIQYYTSNIHHVSYISAAYTYHRIYSPYLYILPYTLPLFSHTLIYTLLFSTVYTYTYTVSIVLSGKWDNPRFAMLVCQILCHLSFCHEKANQMVFEAHIMMTFHLLYRKKLCSSKAACMIAIILRNLSYESYVRPQLLSQNCTLLLGTMFIDVLDNARDDIGFIRPCVLPFLYNISLDVETHMQILDQDIMSLLNALIETQQQRTPPTGEEEEEEEGSSTDSGSSSGDSGSEDSSDSEYSDDFDKSTADNTNANTNANAIFTTASKSLSNEGQNTASPSTTSAPTHPTPTPTTTNDVGESREKGAEQVQGSNSSSNKSQDDDELDNIVKLKQRTESERKLSKALHKSSHKVKVDSEVMTTEDVLFISATINLLSQTEACQTRMIDSDCVRILIYLSRHENTGECMVDV